MTVIPQAVAWTLIHFCWQAAAVAAAYRLVSIALARRTAETRYVAALSSLLLMLALAVGTFAWELRTDPAPFSFVGDTQLAEATQFVAPLAAELPHTKAPGITATQSEPARISLSALLPWIDGLWLVGVLALSVRSFGGWWYLRRLRLAAMDQAPAPVRAAFDRICAALGLTRTVVLRLSTAVDSPMTMGALRAVVLLPLSAITSLGPEEIEVVLAHELAHVRRADFFWNILQTIAETLFFFHPAVWWISGRVRHERELCCDDLALKICPNPVVYAHALVRLEEQRSHRLRLAMALDGHASYQTLLARIARILGEPMTLIPSHSIRPFSLSAAIAGLIVLLVPVPHVLAKLAPAQQPASASVITPIPVPVPTQALAGTITHQVQASPHVTHEAIERALKSTEASRTQFGSTLAATIAATVEAQSQPAPEAGAKPHSDYIDAMKAAGYDVDLDKLIAMKIQGITPEYARNMANAGFGKPSADDLVACKVQGVTPEYIAELKKQGFEIKSFQDAISFRIFNVTPEFVSGMKAAGFDGLTTQQLMSMRVQGVTPEFAQHLKSKFPHVTSEDLIKARIFRIDDQFIAMVAKHGFTNLPFDKLVQLRISGIFDDESVKE
ncbi:MAG TPA: M56 family metallopeptidase [Terracidiphilus sp.]|jgi:beta-lactamase regulating signal transducer with metallopeptidase domain